MTYYDRLNEFFTANELAPLPSSAQLVYLHLLQLNNRQGNAGQFRCTDGHLAEVTRLNKKTVAEARRLLEQEGLLISITQAGNPRAGTLYRLNDGEKISVSPKAPTPKVAPQQEIPPPKKPAPQELTLPKKPVTDYISSNSAEVKDIWMKCEGEHLYGGAAMGLIELENLYGTEAVCRAIITASQANKYPKLTYNYVRAILENQQKGGNRYGGNGVGTAQYAGIDICPD